MKFFKLIIIVLFSLYGVSVDAQIQKGIVKTLGRPDRKGSALSGVTVRVNGLRNPVISNSNGAFSLLMTGKKNGEAFSLQEVNKKGYELNESDVIGRQFAYSNRVPLTIVMVSTSQLQADKQRIENNAYAVAERNYKAKLTVLEEQLTENKISEEQYHLGLLDLQDKFEKYQLLIDGMAEHYAHMDYDVLDEKEWEINQCIENGELERADSLISLMFNPLDVLKRNKDALARLDRHISDANAIIDDANAELSAIYKQQEKDASHLYQLYTIALSRFDNEKAGRYIDTRAELDTANVKWQMDAATFHRLYSAKYDKAISLLQRGLSESYKKYKGWCMISAYILNDLARTYEDLGEMTNADNCYRDAFTICLHYMDTNNREIAMLYNNHGVFLLKNGNYIDASKSLQKAREIKEMLYGIDNIELSNIYNNLGMANYYHGNYDESLHYYQKSLPLFVRQFGECHTSVSNCYNNMGMSYFAINDTTNAMNYLKKALDIRLSLYGRNSLSVAESFNNIGSLFQSIGNISNALDYHEQALAIRKNLLGENHTDVAQSLAHIGDIYDATMDYACIEYFQNATKIYLLSNLNKNTPAIQSVVTKYYNSYCAGIRNEVKNLSNLEFRNVMDNYIILLTITDDNSPAYKLGMTGQYVLLEFDSWIEDSNDNVFFTNQALKGKPKDIIVYDDLGFKKYHFDGNLGAKMELWYIGKAEKEKIMSLYNSWNNNNKTVQHDAI